MVELHSLQKIFFRQHDLTLRIIYPPPNLNIPNTKHLNQSNLSPFIKLLTVFQAIKSTIHTDADIFNWRNVPDYFTIFYF